MFLAINWWAVLLAAGAAYALGALWYSPLLFGNAWESLMGWDADQVAEMRARGLKKVYLANFAANILTAITLWSIGTAACTAWSCANVFAFFAWLGLVMPVHFGATLWEGKPFKLFALNATYSLLALWLMTAILSGFAY